jgi:hypothetical protein
MTATMSAGSPGDEPSVFGKLPYDVRAMIYEIALTRASALEIILFESAKRRSKSCSPVIPCAAALDRPHLIPAILLLSKDIYDEALPFLYSRNTFTFVGLNECRTFADPAISGRELISRVCLHRMAMSRPICRWGILHIFLPSAVKQFIIEIDTHTTSLSLLCFRLAYGLGKCLKNIGGEAARRTYFKEVVRFRFHTTKYLEGRISNEVTTCSSQSPRLLWRSLEKSLDISHAAVERCFKDIIEDELVRNGVLGVVHGKTRQFDRIWKAVE